MSRAKQPNDLIHLVFNMSIRLRPFVNICMPNRYIELFEHDEMHLYHKGYR